MQSTWGGVDYSIIDEIECERREREKAYVCPFWDWLKDFRDRWADEHWWSTVPDWPGNGMAYILDEDEPLVFCNEISGEIG